MRTNILIDDNLMSEAMRLTGLKTKRDVVEKALQVLVRNAGQAAVLALEGNIHWEGDIEQMRQGRYLHEESVEYNPEPSPAKPIEAKPKERKKRNATDTTRHG